MHVRRLGRRDTSLGTERRTIVWDLASAHAEGSWFKEGKTSRNRDLASQHVRALAMSHPKEHDLVAILGTLSPVEVAHNEVSSLSTACLSD